MTDQQNTAQNEAPAFESIRSHCLFVAALHYVTRSELAEAETVLAEMLALPDGLHIPDELADATMLMEQIKSGALADMQEAQREAQQAAANREADRALVMDVIGLCHGDSPRARRKHWLRVRTLELRKAGKTRAAICAELDAKNWEISTCINWLSTRGYL